MSVPLPGRILPLAPGTFRALRNREFRLLWSGQVVSLTGSWMQSVAQGWLVLRLTDSAFYLGLVGFCTFAPVLMLGLAAGVAADRLPRRNSLLWIQGAAMLIALTLGLLTLSGAVRVWQVALLAFAQGTTAAFDIPIRQSFLQDLVGRDDLPNAIALNSMAFNGARLAGPALAGAVLPSFGEAACFLLNAVSFSAVLTGLALIRPPGRRRSERPASWTRSVREGLGYATRSARVRAVLALVMISSVCGMPYSILMPIFARDVLRVGAGGLGVLMGATGLGAVIGALYLAGRASKRRFGRVVAAAMSIFGAGLVAFSFSRSFPLSIALLVVTGGALIVQMAGSNTWLQLTAPAELRGRIVSLYMLSFIGMAPFGALLGGTIARVWGAPVAVGLGGAVCLAAALLFAARIPRLRRSDPPLPDLP